MQGFHESDKLCQEHPNTAFRRFQRQPTLCCTIRTSAQLNENGTDQITSNQNKIDLVSVNRRSIQSVGNVQNRQKTIIQERTTKNQSSIPNELESNKNGF
ncbi:unnamed protein product [Paramecium octaurelia]|nr:unnamed protein product [Paramecium octaurelia]